VRNITALALSAGVLSMVPGYVAEARFGNLGDWEENKCVTAACVLDIPPLRMPVVVLRHQTCMRENYTHLLPLLDEGELGLAGKRVLDVGTGTGAMALLAAHYGASHVVATDIHPVALLNAAYNAELAGWGR
jgi:2-polyprenyl-3-methyl-5-hydroxy-6-metoxy-1,4-benzoquinol methylase